MLEYKYIKICCISQESFNKHKVYRILNRNDDNELGVISFYKPWKQFVFTGHPDCIFDFKALLDIVHFINNFAN